MDRPHIAAEALRAHRRALLVWLVALCGLVALTLAFWPTIRDDPNLQRFAENLPPALRAFAGNGDFLSPAGYLGARLFGVLVPIVFLSLAIGRASDAIAGDEERGTIALLLSSPISRRRLVLEKALAVACELVLLGFLLWLVLVVGGVIVDLEVSAGRLAAASLGAVVLGLFFAVLALAVACQAHEAWKDITSLARNDFICWVEDAKQEVTRERRIRRTQEELEEGQRRPCCWPGCKHRERTGR